jgi:ribose-phosphate pyrophosphokinase
MKQPDTDFEQIHCKKTRFANDEIAVNISESVRNKTIAIIAQPMDYEDNFELLMTIDAARRASAKEIIAVIPSLPHSRQERRPEGERTSISARLYASMLESAGLDRLITVDLHTTAIEGFYTIPVDNLSPFYDFVGVIQSYTANLRAPILVSPDLGGMKRVKKFASILNLPMAFLNKERLRANEIADMTLIGNVDDQDVIIIDDMIDTGGTIRKSLELLYESGANSVRIMATHGLFSNDGYSKLVESDIEEMVVTNTLDQKDGVDFGFIGSKLKVVNVAPLIVGALNKLM